MASRLPVYLFTGFLEGGKTHVIQESMEDKRFNSGGEEEQGVGEGLLRYIHHQQDVLPETALVAEVKQIET